MTIVQSIRKSAAENRSRLFAEYTHNLPTPIKVIDLGGSFEMWRRWGGIDWARLDVTLVNNHHLDKSHDGECRPGMFVREVRRDMRSLTAEDLSEFDVVFSNSAIEHLSSWADQKRVAAAIVASKKPYFVQVPDRLSPIDPHFPSPFVPFFAVYPRALKEILLRFNRLGSGSSSPNFSSARLRMSYYNPLGRSDLRELFPDSNISRQVVRGVSVSLIAMRQLTVQD